MSPNEADPNIRRQVEAMAGYGIPVDAIANVLQLDPEVVAATFAHELSAAATKANARVAENLFRKATGDGREAVVAAIFWLKTRAQWSEVNTHLIEARSYVVHLPPPVASPEEWLHRYAPRRPVSVAADSW